MAPLLKVENLRIELTTRDGIAPVIDDLSFELGAGECISFVGESGCGKSMTALGIMGLLPEKVGHIASGKITFDGEDLTTADEKRMQEIRGNEISMIFQEPMTSLNPVFTIGEQIAEVLRAHQGLGRTAALNSAIDLLDAVRIPNAKGRVRDYPFQMSGGQRQRVMIAMALACEPKILIADEPTTALDVTVQAQILNLLRKLQTEFGLTYLFISHDLGVVQHMCDSIAVMYMGKIVEHADRKSLFNNPLHPYTAALLSAVPSVDKKRQEATKRILIPGDPPDPLALPKGCRFANRCPVAQTRCEETQPDLDEVAPGHKVACHLVDERAVSPL